MIPLSVLLIGLAPLAHASPPDPSWIPGIYDDADFDDVVALVTADAGGVDTTPLDDLCPQPVAAELPSRSPSRPFRTARPLRARLGVLPPSSRTLF